MLIAILVLAVITLYQHYRIMELHNDVYQNTRSLQDIECKLDKECSCLTHLNTESQCNE